MRIRVWRTVLVVLLYLIVLYLRDVLLETPVEEEDFTFSFRLHDGVEELRKQVKEGTYDTYPFLPNTLIQPFFRYKELYKELVKVSPKYSVTTCQIEKTTSLLKDAIFCFLKNPWKFRANGRRISTEQYFTRQCKDEYLAKNYSIVGKSLGRIKFAVLRDPIDRYCNFKEHLDDFIFIRYQKCPSRISAYARELDKIFKMARVPEELRREIYNEILVQKDKLRVGKDPGLGLCKSVELFYCTTFERSTFLGACKAAFVMRTRRLRRLFFALLFFLLSSIYMFLYKWYLFDIEHGDPEPVFNGERSVRFGRYRWNLDDPSLDRSFFDESNVFPPFIRYREYFQDIPEYRLCTCFIEKVMSTIRDGIFCYLRDPIEFVVQNRRISTENYVNRFCSPAAVDRKMCSYTTEKSSRRLKFAVVRDPIDRFLSGYADKCYP
ncbi:hypothetical protein NECAME_06906 [Necator americanus]|uniref:Carbohydrate sulfotransferase n=1 Tax=Necator americanus TaxID=51031 RepID=W2TRQ5_NECAM|nr:hypothetical protein NECAME_06906 [Necator americanus]ETN84344.1 hypothetical protein NECAME_06906 [Necator americanus]